MLHMACIWPLLADRFATDACYGSYKTNPDQYNGGSFFGANKMLGYVTELGFDGIWISPYMKQGDDAFGVGKS